MNNQFSQSASSDECNADNEPADIYNLLVCIHARHKWICKHRMDWIQQQSTEHVREDCAIQYVLQYLPQYPQTLSL